MKRLKVKELTIGAVLLLSNAVHSQTALKNVILDHGEVLHHYERQEVHKYLHNILPWEANKVEWFIGQLKKQGYEYDDQELIPHLAKQHKDLHWPQNLKEQYNQMAIQSIIPKKDVINFVKELKSKGIRLILLSNTSKGQARRLKGLGLYDHFDHIYLSYQHGLRKPDPLFFKKMVTSLNLNPKDCVFIDDKERNTSVAKSLGFHTINFDSLSQLKRELMKLKVI